MQNIKILSGILGITLLSASCSLWPSSQSVTEVPVPDYQRFAENVTIVKQTSTGVIYEYKNVRVDELAVLAALYCHDQAGKKAYLDKITLYRNNSRRAMFICKNT